MKKSIKHASVALAASALLMLALSLAFYATLVWPAGGAVISIFILFFETCAPIYILDAWKSSPAKYNIYAHRLESLLDNLLRPLAAKKLWPDWAGLALETRSLLQFSGLILVPYVLLYAIFMMAQSHFLNLPLDFQLRLPAAFGLELLTQLFIVALPEEIFFRGFLQSTLLKAWPNRLFLKSVPLGSAITITNVIFALSHFVGGFSSTRLLTFFPGMLFSYLAYKNKSIYSSIVFHAICNILAQTLYLSFQIG